MSVRCSLWYDIISTSTSPSTSRHQFCFTFASFSNDIFSFHCCFYFTLWHTHIYTYIFGLHAVQIMPSREFPIPVAHNKTYTFWRRRKKNNRKTTTTPPANMHTTAWHHTTQNHFHHGSNQHIFRSLKVKKQIHTLTTRSPFVDWVGWTKYREQMAIHSRTKECLAVCPGMDCRPAEIQMHSSLSLSLDRHCSMR